MQLFCFFRYSFFLAIFFLISSHVEAGFQTPVAVSADGKTIVVSKERVLYVVDGETLAVRHRIWAGGVVKSLDWGKDGKTLYVIDDAKRLLKLAEGATELSKAIKMEQESGSNLFSGISVGFVAAFKSWPEPKIQVLSLDDGAKKGEEIALPQTFQRAQIMFDNQGKRLILFSGSQKFPEEKENAPEKPEKFEDKLAKEVYGETTDGQGSLMLVVDLETGKTSEPVKISTVIQEGGITKVSGDQLVHLRYGNPCLRMSLIDGSLDYFMTPVFCNYGSGFFPSGPGYVVGGLAEYAYLKDGKTPVSVEIPRDQRVPGWPEYYYGFGVAADGTAFGWTSAGRLAKISPDGQLVDLKPVY